MSISKTLKNGDYREVFVSSEKDGSAPNDYKLLNDLINTDGATTTQKIIASIFLRCTKTLADVSDEKSEKFLVLKPACLWLKASNNNGVIGPIVDQYGATRTSISQFQGYTIGEKIKVSFLQNIAAGDIYKILISQGVNTSVAVISGTANPAFEANIKDILLLKNAFTYDLNEVNRTRSASISTAGNESINAVWL